MQAQRCYSFGLALFFLWWISFVSLKMHRRYLLCWSYIHRSARRVVRRGEAIQTSVLLTFFFFFDFFLFRWEQQLLPFWHVEIRIITVDTQQEEGSVWWLYLLWPPSYIYIFPCSTYNSDKDIVVRWERSTVMCYTNNNNNHFSFFFAAAVGREAQQHPVSPAYYVCHTYTSPGYILPWWTSQKKNK